MAKKRKGKKGKKVKKEKVITYWTKEERQQEATKIRFQVMTLDLFNSAYSGQFQTMLNVLNKYVEDGQDVDYKDELLGAKRVIEMTLRGRKPLRPMVKLSYNARV